MGRRLLFCLIAIKQMLIGGFLWSRVGKIDGVVEVCGGPRARDSSLHFTCLLFFFWEIGSIVWILR